MPYYDQYGPQFDDSNGNNVARDYAQYAASGDFKRYPPGNPFAFLGRLFGGSSSQPNYSPGSVQSEPLAPLPGTVESSAPFGNPQPQPSTPPASKPATQLASAQAIAERISRMIGGPQSAPPVDFSSFFPQGVPIPSFGQQSQMPPFVPPGSQPTAGASPFDIFHMGMHPHTRQRVVMRAGGGEVPGFMRGGYPELRTAPIRHTFDSGGQSYVDQGEGSGRADNINARLSPREYVTDSETLALLGDGNPDEGARKMDELRANIRKQKGKALAKGKISPDAKKTAAEYLVGDPLGDGLRRRGREK